MSKKKNNDPFIPLPHFNINTETWLRKEISDSQRIIGDAIEASAYKIGKETDEERKTRIYTNLKIVKSEVVNLINMSSDLGRHLAKKEFDSMIPEIEQRGIDRFVKEYQTRAAAEMQIEEYAKKQVDEFIKLDEDTPSKYKY